MAEEDIIYGKNRHFFGGIEPSNMLKFKVTNDNHMVNMIEAQLPDNTIINGQTLCSVAGAIIRRKETDYPKDEFDGDLVADIPRSTILADVDAVYGKTYYYAAFPYTTQGVYNRNAANRAGINLPKNMVKFSAEGVYDYSIDRCRIELNAILPEGVSGAVIRKSMKTYPTNEFDGEEFMVITEDGVYADTDTVIGTTYYYAAFPYTTNDAGDRAYNRDTKNSINIMCTKYNYLFGYDVDLDDPDPDTRVTYPSDVDNANYTPAAMNFDINEFDYGDWDIAAGEKFMPRPCMLNYDGTVAHYLDPNDYSKREDGVTPSKVADLYFEGNAMMEWPKIYTHREEVNGVYKFRCSDTKLGEDWDCWCNYDINDNEIDHFYMSIYTVCIPDENATTGTILRSISGQITDMDYSYDNYRLRAKYKGDSSDKQYSWDIGLIADHLLVQDLLVLMAKTTDGKAAYGNGPYNSSYMTTKSGVADDKGLFAHTDEYAGNSSGSGCLKVFGMEHYWSNYYRCVAGWIIHNGRQYVKITKGAHDGVGSSSDSSSTKYGRFNNSYSNKINMGTSAFTTNQGYVSKMLTMPYGRFPIAADGSWTTYECDRIEWSDSSSNSTGLVGGGLSGTAGPFATYVQSSSGSVSYETTTLSCKPVLVTE